MTRKKNGSQVSLLLRDSHPLESELAELYRSQTPMQLGEADFASGAELLKRLLLIGYVHAQKRGATAVSPSPTTVVGASVHENRTKPEEPRSKGRLRIEDFPEPV